MKRFLLYHFSTQEDDDYNEFVYFEGGLRDSLCNVDTLSEARTVMLAQKTRLYASDHIQWIDLDERRLSTEEEQDEFMLLYARMYHVKYPEETLSLGYAKELGLVGSVEPDPPKPGPYDIYYMPGNFDFARWADSSKVIQYAYEPDPNLSAEENEIQRRLRSCRVL